VSPTGLWPARAARRKRNRLSTAAWAIVGASAAAVAWGWFEAGWVRLDERELTMSRLPPELDGLRIAHLSDFHLGVVGRGQRATRLGVAWAASRRPELAFISGDLVARPRGAAQVRELVEQLPPVYAVLGNHDFADSRDPFAKPVGSLDLSPGTLLSDSAATLELRGRRVQVVGVDPRTYLRGKARPWELADATADLRILLCHFPTVFAWLPDGAFDLVLAGHMHDGQICIPHLRGKLRLAHPSAPYWVGEYRRGGAVMHVSAGLGTTFVPFRFCARPEATVLTLRRPRGA
jgi:predicted MPP superfamily phosphohydrolase